MERDKFASSLRQDKCPVFSCYVYEYSKTSSQLIGLPATQQPYFIVTTRGYSIDGQVVSQSRVVPVRMADYNASNGSPTSENNLAGLMRNHIYRFEISGSFQNIQIVWTVCEMDNPQIDIEFN